MLFAIKFNDQLRLCVNYRRLNYIIKRNRYFISLIEKILIKVQNCKYLIKLNIISIFNKFRMNEDNEKLIIFVIFLKFYKYRVLSLELTNDLTNWQHYMNDFLFNYLNEFCQIYLNDTFIYNKFKKKHIVHVRVVFEKLKKTNLQIDIDKCEFFKKEITFLNVLFSIDDFRMNSKKIEIIINWNLSTNLKEMQIFVNFVNFYKRFIRDFFKKIKILIRMIKKLVKFKWIETIEEIFTLLKRTIIETFILRHYDRFKQVILKIDSSNYVNVEMFSQYNDEEILHSIVFYSWNMISVECNYEIYDKKLLIIIRCLKHWRFKFENIDEFVKIFIDHKKLKTFMFSKKLTFRQVRWTEILSKFNIVIQFQSKIQNVKTNVLIRMSKFRSKDENDERFQHRKQMLFIFDRLEIHAMKFDESIYERIFAINKIDDQCQVYRDVFEQKFTSIKRVNLKHCNEKNDVLYYNNRLWMSVDMSLLIDFLKKIHEFSISKHFEFNRMKNFLRRNYYWSNMRKIVRQYMRNCHECQRTKVFKNRKNELFIFLVISLQRWIDIFMNFIIELFDAHDYNVIYTIIDRLNKKRHYTFCTIEDENINVEVIVRIFIQYVFRTHDLFFFITSNRNFQFIFLVWQVFCRIFDIKCKFFTIFHSKIDDQIEKINQNIERQLRQYCNYMLNDWNIWIFMIEFVDNNAIFATTNLSFFFVNKDFHSRMNFSFDFTFYNIIKKRLLIVKAKNIIDIMQNILNYVRDHAEVTQKRMTIQVNKHRKTIEYIEKNYVFFDRRNIKIVKSSNKLDDKKLNSYKILQRLNNVYRLKLSQIMKIHDVFHCWLLRKDLCDFLKNQINELSKFVIVNENFEWKIDDILKSRYHYNRFQYRVNWSNWFRDRTWYYVDNGEFDNVRDVVNDFHRKHFIVANSQFSKSIIIVFQNVFENQNFSSNRRRSRKKVAVFALIKVTFD